ncbi:MAG: hypothetical protein HGA67_03355 [Candidatus Yonathbacteria bacterium]|nr:hypothetical protein [Candidatus Yonathbacteria bacterium]
MEKFSPIKKESGINRVVGFESEKEADILEYFKERFETNSLEDIEKEKTPEETILINRVHEDMAEFLQYYGVEAIDIPLNNIHILDKSKLTKEELKKIQERAETESGVYSSDKQAIGVMKDYEENKLSFLQAVVHEELHLQGFYSYQKSLHEGAGITLKKGDDLVDMNIRRSGFAIGTKDGNTQFFHNVNEAIIVELTIRFEEKYLTQYPELEFEIEARDKYREHVVKDRGVSPEEAKEFVMNIKKDADSEYGWIGCSAYPEDRMQFNMLIDELYERNKTEFQSREDVFNLFARATLTGRILPTARIIEKTFGKGTFRTIGEMTAKKSN